MRIGGAIALLAVGAILTWAINVNSSSGFNINTIGIILMVAGGLWFIAEIVMAASRRRTDVVHQSPAGTSRTTYAEPSEPRY